MRRFSLIAAVAIAAAACSDSSDEGQTPDLGEPIPDAGVDMASGPGGGDATNGDSGLAAEPGELLVEVAGDEVLIHDAGSFLFVVTDGESLGWIRKDGDVITPFADWPSAERPGDGPPSRDTTWDEERFWFLARADSGDWVLAGAEHYLGSPNPFFGQPIVIIDVGPGEPGGLSRFGSLFVVPMDDQLLSVTEGGAPVAQPLGGESLFRKMDQDFLFVTNADGHHLRRFGPQSGQLTTYETVSAEPRAFSASPNGVYFIDGAGSLRLDGTEGEDDSTVVLADTRTSDAPILASSGTAVAWTGVDEVRVLTDELRRFAATDVDAIVVDDAAVYWSGAGGIWRADLEP